MNDTVDILAIGAHPDDVELTCGGTLARMRRLGHRTAILDLTAGELGSRGSRGTRAAEADRAAAVLGLATRLNAGLPDAHVCNDSASRRRVVEVLRQLRPSVVILPYMVGRHPDHRVGSELCRDACFLAGLRNYHPDAGQPHKPLKVVYSSTYREDAGRPSFVVDISDDLDTKLSAIRCYGSQFDDVTSAGELFPNGQPLYELVRTQAAHYGTLIRRAAGEPFWMPETLLVEDLLSLGVQSL